MRGEQRLRSCKVSSKCTCTVHNKMAASSGNGFIGSTDFRRFIPGAKKSFPQKSRQIAQLLPAQSLSF